MAGTRGIYTTLKQIFKHSKMKKIFTLLALFLSFSAIGQEWQFDGTKYPNATNQGDTVSIATKIPIWDADNLQNYFADLGDILALNPVPSTPTWQDVMNQGNTTTQPAIIDSYATAKAFIISGGIGSSTLGGTLGYDVANDLFMFNLKNPSPTETGNLAYFDFTSITNFLGQTYAFPNKSGTIALTSDIPDTPSLQGVTEVGASTDQGINIQGNAGITPFKEGLTLLTNGAGTGTSVIYNIDDENLTEPVNSILMSPLETAITYGSNSTLHLTTETASEAGAGVNSRFYVDDAINPNEAVTLGQMQSSTMFDSRYVNTAGDTMTGTLNIGGNLNVTGNGVFDGAGGNNVRIYGSATGNANIGYLSIYESDGTTRQGYIGFPSPSHSNLYINNDVGNNQLVLNDEGGPNGLKYLYGSGTRTVFHDGNHYTNADTDALYISPEQGTFTPTLEHEAITDPVTYSASSAEGAWVKTGNTVIINIRMDNISQTGGTPNPQAFRIPLHVLPFDMASQYFLGDCVMYVSGVRCNSVILQGEYIRFMKTDYTGYFSNLSPDDVTFTGTEDIFITATFITL